MANVMTSLFLLLLGGSMAYAGHDVTDSTRTIVVVGGWAVATLGLLLASGAVVLVLRRWRVRSQA